VPADKPLVRLALIMIYQDKLRRGLLPDLTRDQGIARFLDSLGLNKRMRNHWRSRTGSAAVRTMICSLASSRTGKADGTLMLKAWPLFMQHPAPEEEKRAALAEAELVFMDHDPAAGRMRLFDEGAIAADDEQDAD
jgi:hypothetical protein